MGGLVKAVGNLLGFKSDTGDKEYQKALAEQEKQQKVAEEKARKESIDQAKANALADAERKQRQATFLGNDDDDEDKLGGNKSLV